MVSPGVNTGPLLLSCGDDGIRIWKIDINSIHSNADVANGTHVVSHHEDLSKSVGPTSCVRWYPSGKLFAAGMRNGSIVFRHYKDYRVIDIFHHDENDSNNDNNDNGDGGGYDGVSCLCVSGGSRYLVVGSGGGEIGVGFLRVWDMKTRKVDRVWKVSAEIKGVAFQATNDSRYVAAGVGGEVILYSRASGRLVERYEVGGGSTTDVGGLKGRVKVVAVAFSPRRVNLLVAADDIGSVYVWDVARTGVDKGEGGRGSIWAKFAATFKAPVTDLAFSETADHWLYVGGLDKQVRVYDLDGKRLLRSIHCPGPISSVSCSTDGVTLAAGSSTGSIFVYDLRTECIRPVMTIEAAHKSSLSDSYPTSTEAVRSLHFQPKYGHALSASPKTSRHMISAREDPPQLRSGKSRETNSVTPTAGKTPARSEFVSGDSNVFSPPADTDVAREKQKMNSYDKQHNDNWRRQNSIQRRAQLARFMNNRRESEVIPTASSPTAKEIRSNVFKKDGLDSEHLLASSTDQTVQDIKDVKSSSSNISQRLGSINEDYCGFLSPVIEETDETYQNSHSGRKRESVSDILKHVHRPPKPPAVPRSRSDETGKRKNVDTMERIEGYYSGKKQDGAIGSLDFQKNAEFNITDNNSNNVQRKREQNLQETVLRRIIAEEIDALREDLRSDVINLHTEVVMSFARQTEDLRKAMDDRDVAYHALKEELRIVKDENRRLRRLNG